MGRPRRARRRRGASSPGGARPRRRGRGARRGIRYCRARTARGRADRRGRGCDRRRGAGDGDGRPREHGVTHARRRRARHRGRRRADAPRVRGGDRIRGRRRARAEGEVRDRPPLAGARCTGPARRRRARDWTRSAVRRTGGRAPAGQGPVSRQRRRESRPARVGRRRRRHRQVTPFLGVREVHRRIGRNRLVAPWTLPLLRRRRRLLGTRGDGARAGEDPRGRGCRELSRQAAGDPGAPCP